MKTLIRQGVVAAALWGMALGVQAQPAASGEPALAPLELVARDLSGVAYDVRKLKGRVAIVFFWSSRCAVCRSSLPELRANMAGWAGKPFALVTVNVDRSDTDWRAYEDILARTQPGAARPVSLWQDPAIAAPPKLPLTLLLDPRGRVVSRYEGRMAPEAWDAVADLLP